MVTPFHFSYISQATSPRRATRGAASLWGVAWVALTLSAPANHEPMPTEVRAALPATAQGMVETALDAGDPVLLHRLFSHGVPVETLLAGGDTPLLQAARTRRPELAAVCLDWCARTGATDAHGLTALTLAVLAGDHGLAALLAEAGADPNHALPAPLPPVVVSGFDQPWFQTQLKHDPGMTPLMLASVRGDEEMVRLLLGHGGKPYQRTRRYTTDALTLACRAGQIRAAQRLLRRDPDDETGQKLVVALGEQRVTLFRGPEAVLSSKVSTGRKGYATPPGEYLITSKHRDWISTIYKAPMPYLLRLNASAIGLHQGVVPGYPASHGCIRLPAGPAAAFFKTARIGDRVLIRH
jgi:lipoprotein-anchoring transpeptidase ErfK/SrfK